MKTLLLHLAAFTFAATSQADDPALGTWSWTDPKNGNVEVRTFFGGTWKLELRNKHGVTLYTCGGPWKMEGQTFTNGLPAIPGFGRVPDPGSGWYVEKTAYTTLTNPNAAGLNEVRRYFIDVAAKGTTLTMWLKDEATGKTFTKTAPAASRH